VVYYYYYYYLLLIITIRPPRRRPNDLGRPPRWRKRRTSPPAVSLPRPRGTRSRATRQYFLQAATREWVVRVDAARRGSFALLHFAAAQTATTEPDYLWIDRTSGSTVSRHVSAAYALLTHNKTTDERTSHERLIDYNNIISTGKLLLHNG